MRVLIPIEVEPYIEAQYDFVRSYAWPDDTEIKILHVLHSVQIEGTMVSSLGYLEQIMKDARGLSQKMSNELANKIKQSCPQLKVIEEIKEGDAVSVILQEAEDWKADTIVMGSQGRQGVGSFVLGSVAYAVLAKSPCRTIILGIPKEDFINGSMDDQMKVELKLK